MLCLRKSKPSPYHILKFFHLPTLDHQSLMTETLLSCHHNCNTFHSGGWKLETQGSVPTICSLSKISNVSLIINTIILASFSHLSMADGWVLETQLPSHLASSTSSSQVLTSSFVGPYSSWIGCFCQKYSSWVGFFVKSIPPGRIGFI